MVLLLHNSVNLLVASTFYLRLTYVVAAWYFMSKFIPSKAYPSSLRTSYNTPAFCRAKYILLRSGLKASPARRIKWVRVVPHFITLNARIAHTPVVSSSPFSGMAATLSRIAKYRPYISRAWIPERSDPPSSVK